jgi:hypothetical protein
LRKQVHKSKKKPRYTLKERLQVIWYLEYFHIPRRQVKKTSWYSPINSVSVVKRHGEDG